MQYALSHACTKDTMRIMLNAQLPIILLTQYWPYIKLRQCTSLRSTSPPSLQCCPLSPTSPSPSPVLTHEMLLTGCCSCGLSRHLFPTSRQSAMLPIIPPHTHTHARAHTAPHTHSVAALGHDPRVLQQHRRIGPFFRVGLEALFQEIRECRGNPGGARRAGGGVRDGPHQAPCRVNGRGPSAPADSPLVSGAVAAVAAASAAVPGCTRGEHLDHQAAHGPYICLCVCVCVW